MKLARNPLHTIIPQLRLYGDEAGRGPLAGPVFVGIVIPLQKIQDSALFRDSKQLSEKNRTAAYNAILELQEHGVLFAGTGYATQQEIDKHGIIKALRLAVYRAIFHALKALYLRTRRENLLASPYGEDILAAKTLDRCFLQTPSRATLRTILHCPQSVRHPEALLFDGNHTFGVEKALSFQVTTIIKGDQKNLYIGLGSILAKVERDRYMQELGPYAPQYGLSTHKGYGTATHRHAISQLGITPLHRVSFCKNISTTLSGGTHPQAHRIYKKTSSTYKYITSLPSLENPVDKPKLLLHICCAPDLTRPLYRLKHHFKLALFWYNPNIHPRQEHTKRYAQFLKLVGLEEGDYEILEDRYDPKEFFQAMIEQKTTITPTLADAEPRKVLQIAGEMEERSDRCNPCYSMRLHQAAKTAAANNIPYFTSTLLISPKKHGGKLFQRGIDAEKTYPSTKFLRFDFAKNQGYIKAVELTRKHSLRRQNYCGCGRTIPKQGEDRSGYAGG